MRKRKKLCRCGGKIKFDVVSGNHCIGCGLIQPNQKYPYGTN